MTNFKLLLLSFALTSLSLSSQVTIGSAHAPSRGALLDLKQFDDTQSQAGGPTAQKGLGLPRVKIVSPTQLELEGYTGTALALDEHVGLLVYNMTQKDGVAISQHSEMLCPGLHVWDGAYWVPLLAYPTTGLTCIDGGFISGTTPIYILSGQDERGSVEITPVNLTWEPYSSTVSVVQSDLVVDNITLPRIDFNTPLSTTIADGGSDSYNLNAKIFTTEEITSNLFKSKGVKLTFTVIDENGIPQIFTSDIYQTNYALKVDSKQEDKVIRKIMDGPVSINLEGNVKWDAQLSDALQTSISQTTGGVYLNTGTSNSFILTYTIDRDETKPENDLSVKFTDYNEPIWKNLTFTVSECKGGPIDLENDKPVSVGILTDHQGYKYWTRTFGTAGTWMLQNLRTTEFPPTRTSDFAGGNQILSWIEDLSVNPSHGFNSGTTYTENKWVRPESFTTPNTEMSEEEFASYHELGLLYDFTAVSGLKTNMSNQGVTLPEGTTIQGMCPNGWRVPNQGDYMRLFREINSNTETYSSATDAADVPLKPSDYPGTSIFQTGVTVADRQLLLTALLDPCYYAGADHFPNASLKQKGGFGLSLSRVIVDGVYDYYPTAPSNSYGGVWQLEYLEVNELGVSSQDFSLTVNGTTGSVSLNFPYDYGYTNYMKPVRCIQN